MNNPQLINDRIISLGVCGVRTVYKGVDLLERLRSLGAGVRVYLDGEAEKFVTPLTFESISGNEVMTETPGGSLGGSGSGIDPVESDITVIAPASFSFIGKLASELGTDILTELASNSDHPALLAPAMNRNLYSSRTVRSHLEQLESRGFDFVEPKPWGAATERDRDFPLAIVPERIIGKIGEIVGKDRLLENKKVLITSGPTREAFGPGSYGTGRSQQTLGYLLSKQARQMGAEVLLVSGPTEQVPPSGVGVVWVRTLEELDKLLVRELPNHDLILMAGAASDWETRKETLLPREEKTKRFNLDFEKAPDVLRKLGKPKEREQVLVSLDFNPKSDNSNLGEKMEVNDLDAYFCGVEEEDSASVSSGSFSGKLFFNSGNNITFQAQNSSQLSRKIVRELGKVFFNPLPTDS